MVKTLIQLFVAFAKIGFTSFGGTSMIPLIMDEMLSLPCAHRTPGCCTGCD